jgi:hypothetical protein
MLAMGGGTSAGFVKVSNKQALPEIAKKEATILPRIGAAILRIR